MIWTTAFWQGASERALKTFAQTLVAYFAVGTTGLLDVDWAAAASVSGAAALASLLTSIGNADFTAGVHALPLEEPGTGDPASTSGRSHMLIDDRQTGTTK